MGTSAPNPGVFIATGEDFHSHLVTMETTEPYFAIATLADSCAEGDLSCDGAFNQKRLAGAGATARGGDFQGSTTGSGWSGTRAGEEGGTDTRGCTGCTTSA